MLTRNCTQRMNAGIRANSYHFRENDAIQLHFYKPKLVDINGQEYSYNADLVVGTNLGTSMSVQTDFYPNSSYPRMGYNDYTTVIDTANGDAYSFLWIGTGDTKETMYDYKLAEDVNANDFSHLSATSVFSDEGWFAAGRTFKYIGENDIVIKEAGWFVTARSYMGSSNIPLSNYSALLPDTATTPYMFMMAREVLDNPITISPGEIFSVNMLMG